MAQQFDRSLKINCQITIWPSNCTPRYEHKGTEKRCSDTCRPMLTASWFTVAKSQKQPECPSADDWINKVWSIHIMEYYSVLKNKWNSNTFYHMDELWRYTNYSRSNQVDTKGQILYDPNYMRDLNKWTHRKRRRIVVTRGLGLWKGEGVSVWVGANLNNVKILNATEFYVQKWLKW